MRELKTANHALGDRDALNEIWRTHGYWFFRDVLDKDALRAMRDEYMAELRELDVVDADAVEPFWNGRPLDRFPSTFHTLHERHVWQRFVRDPAIKAFFEEVLEDELYWIPMDYYRVVAPNPSGTADAFLGLHQDGLTNPGMEFVTCWMPLTKIDDKTGGLVVAEGQHHRGYLQVIDGKLGFSEGPALEQSWARADYELGDVVIFPQTMPHFGMGNVSDRFRLSLDIRPVRRSGRIPVVGPLKSVSTERVVIESDQGEEVSLALTDATFLRAPDVNGHNPVPIKRAQAPGALQQGMVVMATRDDDGQAMMLRPAMG